MRKSITAPGRETEKNFIRLTRAALEEQDRDKLIDLLMERNKLFTEMQAAERPLDMSLEEMNDCLRTEADILSRLEQERRMLLSEMDDFSKSRSAVQKYRASFPFPPLPVFFGSST